MNPVTVIPGDGPIVLAQPHSGTFVPQDIAANLTARGRKALEGLLGARRAELGYDDE